MRLSVCLLTRNEETNIARALHSVAGVADEVLVADTASRDRTAAVAADLGARVFQFAWEDDFAAGRNFLVSQATGDWMLLLNADEELLPESREPLRECLTGDAFAFLVLIREQLEAGRPDFFTETADLRLFRRRPDLRFIGRCHPAVDGAVAEAVRREGLSVRPSPVALRHHAYLTRRDDAKLRWSARLLELELRDRPGQLRYLIEYGRTLLHLGDPKGHAVLQEAADQLAPQADAPTPPSAKVQVLLEYLLTSPERSPGKYSAAKVRELALRWFPSSPMLLWTMAGQDYARGDFRQAAGLLERLLQLGRTRTYDRSQRFDPIVMGDQAVLNLGVCYLRLGELDRAEACFRQILANSSLGGHAAQHLAALQARRRASPGPSTPGFP